MALSTSERRALLAEGHRLKPAMVVSADKLTAATIDHVRAGLATRRLMKLRIQAASGAACDAAAEEVARQVQAEVVKRIGRAVLLYRRGTGSADVASGTDGATG